MVLVSSPAPSYRAPAKAKLTRRVNAGASLGMALLYRAPAQAGASVGMGPRPSAGALPTEAPPSAGARDLAA